MKYILFFIPILCFFGFVSLDTPEKITTKEELGKKLFFEKKLSQDNKISCGSCHIPSFAFADTVPLSRGVGGRFGKRNTPSAMNMASRELFFFDGRANTLEEQAVFPIEDHNEMAILMDDAVVKIASDKTYQNLFKKLYNSEVKREHILNAISEFERSLESSSPFDEYMQGNSNAISASARRGHSLFTKKENRCFECHFTPDFTGDEFRNVGLFDNQKYKDSGRYLITKNINDLGKFKVPGLRNVAITMPYMHDGSMKTLREVIEHYSDIHNKVPRPINADSLLLAPIKLTVQDITDIENFLISLTDKRFNNLLYAKYPNHRRRK